MPMQPCWTCQKCYGGCSWTDVGPDGKTKFEPVEGWKAVPVKKLSMGTYMDGYEILYCPEYVSAGTAVKGVSDD